MTRLYCPDCGHELFEGVIGSRCTNVGCENMKSYDDEFPMSYPLHWLNDKQRLSRYDDALDEAIATLISRGYDCPRAWDEECLSCDVTDDGADCWKKYLLRRRG